MKFISSFIIAVFIFSTAVIIEEFIESIKVKNKWDFIYLIILIIVAALLYFHILEGFEQQIKTYKNLTKDKKSCKLKGR